MVRELGRQCFYVQMRDGTIGKKITRGARVIVPCPALRPPKSRSWRIRWRMTHAHVPAMPPLLHTFEHTLQQKRTYRVKEENAGKQDVHICVSKRNIGQKLVHYLKPIMVTMQSEANFPTPKKLTASFSTPCYQKAVLNILKKKQTKKLTASFSTPCYQKAVLNILQSSLVKHLQPLCQDMDKAFLHQSHVTTQAAQSPGHTRPKLHDL